LEYDVGNSADVVVVELAALAELGAMSVAGGSLLLQPTEMASTANEVTAKIEARSVRMSEILLSQMSNGDAMMARLACSCLPSRVRSVVVAKTISMLAISFASVCCVTDASAQAAPQLTLTWKAPSECTSEADVRMRVDRILGANATPRENVDARVNVWKNGETFRAEMQLFSAGQTSTRHVDDASCDALADAVALIVALTVNPEAVAPKREPAPAKSAPAPRAAAAPVTPPPEKKSDAQPERRAPRHPVYVGAALMLDTATLAALAVGAEISAGYNPRHVAAEAFGTWLSAEDAHLAAGSTQGASEFSFGAGARGCWEIFDAAFDIGPCGGAELSGIFASGFNAARSGDTSVALFRALVGGRAKLRFSRFALRLDAEAAIPFTRPSFVIDDAGTVQHVSPATLRATFGAEAHF
jgi:hypothetical protein